MEFQQELSAKVKNIEELLSIYLPDSRGTQKIIFEAMEYSLLAGGKRIRPLIMKEIYTLFEGENIKIDSFMVAMEMIHTYSLVHDDLPAMDNDDYRRGRKTTHIVYGEDMGILCGDGLLNYAFELASNGVHLEENLAQENVDIYSKYQQLELSMKALQILSHKAGVYGMIGGQVIDVNLTGKSIEREVLDEIFTKKTAALIEASFMIGGILGGATKEEVNILERMGTCVGMAFQIQDDILDVTATQEELGKPINSDLRNKKTTYPSLLGIDKSQEMVKKYSQEALQLLEELPGEKEFLQQLINMLIYRKN